MYIPIIPMLNQKFYIIITGVTVYFHAKGFGVKLFKARYLREEYV